MLAAELWIRAVEHFQVGLIAALDAPGEPLDAGVEAALHTVRWSRRNFAAARMLLLYRDVDFVDASVPAEIQTRVQALNTPLLGALRGLARRLYSSANESDLRRVGFAVVDIPYGAVHRHLAVGKPLPVSLDGLVAEAARTMLIQEPIS